MSAYSFFKKQWAKVACALSVCIVFSGCFYAWRISSSYSVEMQTSFYFLVTEDEHVEVGAEFARLEGGAGYLYDDGEKYRVALAVYLQEKDGVEVQDRLLSEGRELALVHKGVDRLYFKGRKREKAAVYTQALRLWESYMQYLNGCILRLEKGLTQEGCKRLLQELKKQFAYAEETYKGYDAYAFACGKMEENLCRLEEETVYLKDLRYLLCLQADEFLQLCAEFSL